MTQRPFVEPSQAPGASEEPAWKPIVIPRASITEEISRLAESDPGPDGRRRSLIVHPRSTGPGWGLAPSIQVTLDVLRPGETSPVVRQNSAQVAFCIQGDGTVDVNGTERRFGRFDTWNIASMACYSHSNTGSEVQARLVYSNAALLEMMRVHFVEVDPPESQPEADPSGSDAFTRAFSLYDELLTISADGAQLMTYERLVNPPVQDSPSLLWRWDDVRAHLDHLASLGQDYRGRRLYLLYNPATGRTNGTTHNLFATITMRPADIVDRPHRHSAAAINYYFAGHGWSRVGGQRYEWHAGDLMLSAPGWVIHHHASGDETVYELTVQDSPLNLAMDSLLWQEDLQKPPTLIGSHLGFATNRQSS